ncbi:MAG: hypothetical protein PHN56_03045 [Candidatus Nanoarchaeia archaeon]|nr:hypothetical protein [Candidatus Nanoarchaeia archaeon]
MNEILENKFQKTIDELKKQKEIAIKEDNLLLIYALQKSIYSLSLLDGYVVLLNNYRYNSFDMLKRPMCEITLQNLFMYFLLVNKKIEWKNPEKKFKLEIITLGELNDFLKKFTELDKKRTLYELKNEKDIKNIIHLFHNSRKALKQNKKEVEELLPSIHLDKIYEHFNEESNFFIHNCCFINSKFEGKYNNGYIKKEVENITFFYNFIISTIQLFLKYYNKEVQFE